MAQAYAALDTHRLSGRHDVVISLAIFYLSSIVVGAAALFGHTFLRPGQHSDKVSGDMIGTFCRWDGVWYLSIAHEGYNYDAQRKSNLAFFPALPVVAAMVGMLLGVRLDVALLIVSNVFLVAAVYVLLRYGRCRRPMHDTSIAELTAVCFALFPTTFFLRMAYSESLFVFWQLLFLFGLERRWPVALVALISGVATSTRAVGIACLLPLCVYAWQRFAGRRCRVPAVAASLVVGCWGIGAFMFYQWRHWGDPLLFAKSQVHWSMRPVGSFSEKINALITLEPLWSTYLPQSEGYWRQATQDIDPIVSLQFANPVYFIAFVVMIGVGWRRKLITHYEGLLSIGLLVIPYVTRGYEMSMASQGRFASVVIPAYFVMARGMSLLPAAWWLPLAAPFIFLLIAYSALFAAGYVVI